jgi:hypothetical protein
MMERRHGRPAGPRRYLPACSLLSEIQTLSDLFVLLTQILVKCLAPNNGQNKKNGDQERNRDFRLHCLAREHYSADTGSKRIPSVCLLVGS